MNNFISKLDFNSIKTTFIFFVNISFILGIIFQKNNLNVFFIFSSIIIYYFIKILNGNKNIKENIYQSIILILFFFLGNFLLKKQQQSFDDFQKKIINKNFEIIGKVNDIENLVESKMKYKINFEIEKMKSNGSHWEIVNKKIQLFTNKIKNLEIDDKIHIQNIKFTQINNNSFKEYLIKENFFSSLFLYNFYFKIIKKQKFSLKKIINNLKTQIIENLKSKMNARSFFLFSSIFLGNKNICKTDLNETKDLFKIWGLSHYLARSGLHLVIIASIWYFLMSILFLSFELKNLLIVVLMSIYHILSWSSIPFIRSLFMFFLYKLCLLSNLQLNSLHFLSMTTLFILITNPIQLFFLDFQLSFSLTYALIWISKLKSKKIP